MKGVQLCRYLFGKLYSKITEITGAEGKMSTYFTVAIVSFFLSFLFLPTYKMIHNFYYVFVVMPAVCAVWLRRAKLNLKQLDVILWGVLFLWCALSGSLVLVKDIVYVAIFLLIVSRVVSIKFFCTSVFARAMFWIVVGHVFLSVMVFWIMGEYHLGLRVIDLLGKMFCIFVSIWIAASLALVLPRWIAEKRMMEMIAGLLLALIAIIYILQSRSGLIAMIPSIAIMLRYTWHGKQKTRLMACAFIVLSICSALALIYLTSGASETIIRGDSGRVELWEKLWSDWKQCGIVMGCGPEFVSQQTFSGDNTIYNAHSVFFAFALHAGLPALLVFIGISFYSLYKSFVHRNLWGGYLLAALTGLTINGSLLINSPDLLWVLVLLPMALIAGEQEPAVTHQ